MSYYIATSWAVEHWVNTEGNWDEEGNGSMIGNGYHEDTPSLGLAINEAASGTPGIVLEFAEEYPHKFIGVVWGGEQAEGGRIMKLLSEMPTQGQFVAVWEYAGVPWSCVYKWEDGELLAYNVNPENYDEFETEAGGSVVQLNSLNASYIIVE